MATPNLSAFEPPDDPHDSAGPGDVDIDAIRNRAEKRRGRSAAAWEQKVMQSDIDTLLSALAQATSEAAAAEDRYAALVEATDKQEATIWLLGRYLNDEEWIAVNKIRDTPGWEARVGEVDLDGNDPAMDVYDGTGA